MARPKASSLSDINFAFNGEQESSSTVQDDIVRIAQADAPETENDYVIFKLVNSNKKGGTYLPNVDDVINPETGREERIRLLTGVSSIWLKDQKDLTIDYIRQNGKSISFPRGQKCLRIPKRDKTSLEFANICRWNIKNGKMGSSFDFFEYDPAKQAEEAMVLEELELEMAMKVKDMEDSMVKMYALFVGLKLNDEVGELKPPKLLKKDLMMYAKRNAPYFQKLIGDRSREVQVNFLVKKAINGAFIDIGSTAGKAFWSNGGGLIGIIPQTRKAPEFLTELALTNNEEGRQFLKQLQTVVK